MEFKMINTTYLESISGGDTEIIKDIINIFKAQIPEFLSEMNSLLLTEDYHNLGLLAHKSKSSIAIMGMEDLAIMLKEFEIDARGNLNPGKYKAYISRFEKDTKEAIIELDRYLNNQ
jgi:HPt (histidine-containing phosphotransfer) domain-containing protein